jgi:hypothetical protein
MHDHVCALRKPLHFLGRRGSARWRDNIAAGIPADHDGARRRIHAIRHVTGDMR